MLRRASGQSRCLASGASLLEVLVVLGLFGILAAGATPGIRRMNLEWALWGGTCVLESSLLWARTHAISANDWMSLVVDDDGRRFYWLDPAGARYEDSVRYLPAGVRIVQSPKKSVRFFQHGNAVPAGTFILQNEAGTYRVVVSAQGRIRVQRDP